MLDFTNCSINTVIAHQVGNITNGDPLILSPSPLDLEDIKLDELLKRYFLYPFESNEAYYSFNFSNGDFQLNPLYQFAADVFADADNFETTGKNIAQHLYEVAVHPNIKAGDVFIVLLDNMVIENEPVKALGIFKAENLQEFLKLDKRSKNMALAYDDGINVDKPDKGCLIFDVDKENGYRICIIDKVNKAGDTRYWTDFFLNVTPVNTDYHLTNQFLGITKQYVTRQMGADFEVSKTDKIDLLNRSVDYFKTHSQFNKEEFEEEVFHHANIIDSFRQFDQSYRQENELEEFNEFEISAQAVKKQARAFKSVLKLDKNFHIYIHGNREMIEQGIDENGRKYYKIYYEHEA